MMIPAVVQAADPASAPAATVKGKKPKGDDPNEVICRKEEVLGSRLRTQRICMTRSEWAETRRANRTDVERAQVQRGSISQ